MHFRSSDQKRKKLLTNEKRYKKQVPKQSIWYPSKPGSIGDRRIQLVARSYTLEFPVQYSMLRGKKTKVMQVKVCCSLTQQTAKLSYSGSLNPPSSRIRGITRKKYKVKFTV